jgi:hypothetical protein
MKRNLFILALAAFFASCNNETKESSLNDTLNTETEQSSDGAAVISFTQDIYEFGKIKEGEKVSYDFEFKNTGNAPLIIKNAEASCGCTVPEIPSKPIAPGETEKIGVIFNSTGKSGLQDRVITITANTIPEVVQIHLIGEIVQ